jgi:hypothetical protein
MVEYALMILLPMPAACITDTVLEETPEAATVTVAERVEVEVFSAAVTVTVPLLEPDDGLTVSHD